MRIGNAASKQLQIDVWGEVMDALYLARRMKIGEADDSWSLQQMLVEHLETLWPEPDEGIWEVRGGRRHFTHSKVMAWVAFDRAIKSIEESRARRARRSLEGDTRRDSRIRVRARLRPRARHVRPALWRR